MELSLSGLLNMAHGKTIWKYCSESEKTIHQKKRAMEKRIYFYDRLIPVDNEKLIYQWFKTHPTFTFPPETQATFMLYKQWELDAEALNQKADFRDYIKKHNLSLNSIKKLTKKMIYK